MPMFASRPLTTSSKHPLDIPQNYVGRTAKTANVGTTIRQVPKSIIILCVENKIQNTGLKWFRFSVGSNVTDQRSGDGWFLGWAKIFTISTWKRFSKFWDAGRKDCFGSEQDHPEFPVHKEGQPRGAESPKRGPVSASETNRLHDLRLLSSDWCSWRSIGLCWFLLCYSSWCQLSGIRYEMGRSSNIDDKKSIRWNPGKSVQIEDTWVWSTQRNVLELHDMEIHQNISVPNYQKLKTMVKRCVDQKLRLRNFHARYGRLETGAVVKRRKGLSGVEGGKGICYQWKEKGQCSQGDRCSFRHESNDRAEKPEHTAATPSKMCRRREVSEAK